MPGGFVKDGNLKAKHDEELFDVASIRKFEEIIIKMFLMLVGIPLSIYISTIYFATILVGAWFGWVVGLFPSTILVIKYLNWLKRRLDKEPVLIDTKIGEFKKWKLKKSKDLRTACSQLKGKFLSALKRIKLL